MAISKVYIDPKKKKKNGTLNVYILVHLDYKSVKFNTGVSCLESEFDVKSSRIKGNTKEVQDNNLIIEACMARINEIFVRYRLQNIPLTADLLKNEWSNPTRRIDFHSFLKEAIDERRADVAHGTYKNHKAFATKIKAFKASLAFSEITPDLIEKFARWLKTKDGGKLDVNTVHGQLRRFRAYLNIAVRKGVIDENPFSRVKLRKKQTERVNLSKQEVTLLWNQYKKRELPENLQSVLRHFLFMCFTGVRISDLKNLTDDSVEDRMLKFAVQKTKNSKDVQIKIPLTLQALQLILDEDHEDSKLFHCISDQKMNTHIKTICSSVGINKHVTNHTGRHTFATLFLKETKNLAVLQKLLGHSDIKETMIYVHVDDDMVMEDMRIFQKNVFQNRLQPTMKLDDLVTQIYPN